MKNGVVKIVSAILSVITSVFRSIFTQFRFLYIWVKKHKLLVSILGTVMGTIVGAFAGAFVSMKWFEPNQQCKLAEQFYLSSLASAENEVRANSSTLLTIEDATHELNPTPSDVDDKVHNLKVISGTPELGVVRYQQLIQHYDELPQELKDVYINPEKEITQLYDAYMGVNKHLAISRTTVIATLSFQTWIVDNYLPDTFNNLILALSHTQSLSTDTAFSDLKEDKNVCSDWF